MSSINIFYIFLILLIFIIVIFLINKLLNPSNHTNSIDSNNAKKLIIQNKFDYIVDIRTNTEWNNGHYPGAVHIPFDVFYKQIIYYKKNSNFLIYSKTGKFARVVSLYMKQKGFTNVKYLDTAYTSI
jgi:rhodanese-related sulfurtransferase